MAGPFAKRKTTPAAERKILPSAEDIAAKKLKPKVITETRSEEIKFHVTPSEKKRFLEMLDGRPISPYLHKKFQELLK